MERHADHGLIVRPFENFGTSCEWMRAQLRDRGLSIHGASRLAKGLATLEAFRKKVVVDDYYRFDSTDACYDFMAEVYGAEFLTKSIHWGATSGLELDERRWKLLGKSDPLITRTTTESDKPRNETWEIILASLAATFASDVSFDEPDVLCTYRGRKYAIAAKVAYSKENLIENIEKGFKQARSKADAVLVFVDVVSLYPQVETLRWSHSRKFTHNDEAVEAMIGSVTRWCSNWPLEGLAEKLRSEATEPVGVAFFVPMFMHMAGAPRPFLYTHMPLTWGTEGPDYEFARAFLRRCNVVGSFAPGVDMGDP